jgi:ubiquinone/menaquinone biosynthesis C-methylase UbiE
MGLYGNRILPHLIHVTMRQETFTPYRQRVLSAASGRVLEIGVGSGENLPFYTDAVTHIVGLDPSARLLAWAKEKASTAARAIELIEASAESIPLDARSMDTIVTTWTLCSIPNVVATLDEMRRVMKPDGSVLFVEHGQSPELSVRAWQDRLTPIWRRLAGGCHLNRPIRQLVEDSGFQIEYLENSYMKGPKPMTYLYEGRARP